MKRCTWCNLNNPKYIEYHDHEWGKLNTDEEYLFEMMILESFQAGLSWQCVLNKREAFKEAYEDFDIDKVIEFDEEKIEQLRNNPNIIRNKLKIKASISNAKIFFNPFKKSIKLFIIIYVLLHMERLFMKQEKLHRLFQIPYQMI